MSTSSAPNAKVIESISKIIVMHPTLSNAISAIEESILQSPHRSEPINTLIVGHSGCGKSTLCDVIAEKHPEEDREYKLGCRRYQPILMTSLPSPVTPKSLASAMLRALGQYNCELGTTMTLTHRLTEALKECGVILVVLDEFQHLYSVGAARNGSACRPLREVQDWIKSLLNKTKIPIVLVGMPDCESLVDSEPQISRRFPNVFRLSPFDMQEDGGKKFATFAEGLAIEIGKVVPGIRDFVDFEKAEYQNAYRLCAATDGNPAAVKALLLNATLAAVARRQGGVSLKLLSETYMGPGGANGRKITNRYPGDPFADSIDAVKTFILSKQAA